MNMDYRKDSWTAFCRFHPCLIRGFRTKML